MIENPYVGMRVRFCRDDHPALNLNNQIGTITYGPSGGSENVLVTFDDLKHGINRACWIKWLFGVSPEEIAKDKERRARSDHAMKFL